MINQGFIRLNSAFTFQNECVRELLDKIDKLEKRKKIRLLKGKTYLQEIKEYSNRQQEMEEEEEEINQLKRELAIKKEAATSKNKPQVIPIKIETPLLFIDQEKEKNIEKMRRKEEKDFKALTKLCRPNKKNQKFKKFNSVYL